MSVQVHFLPDNITVKAEPGEPMLKVAQRAGVCIPTGCLMGTCFACEVELDGKPVRACLTAIPSNKTEFTINIYQDFTW
ncbi:MAG: (2Fe-2S)-binding protein [Cyanobacteria bacterium J083]|nr:MAG: (2Fe-2S)-binding protein [Cyanobacteria bacterium J083]